MHKCLKHDRLWMTTPSRALCGVGCDLCHSERVSEAKTKTHEWYEQEARRVAPHIQVIGKYQKMTTPIKHYCTLHDVEWDASPDNILRGHGCWMCGNEKIGAKNRKPFDKYRAELQQYNKNIVCVGEYVDMTTPVRHRCIVDGYEWDTAPAWLLSGRGCPMCSNRIPKTTESFRDEILQINPLVEVIGDYVNVKTRLQCRCVACGNEWETSPASLLGGSGCPACSQSHGERAIKIWLDMHDINYSTQKKYDDCKDERQLPFDFYLPDYDTLIEYDGEQHYRPVDFFGGEPAFQKLVRHDSIKAAYCERNNINLLRIPYNEDVNTTLNNYILTQ